LFFVEEKMPRTTTTKQSLEPVELRSRLKRENLEYYTLVSFWSTLAAFFQENGIATG
jgi:hypothetical protein